MDASGPRWLTQREEGERRLDLVHARHEPGSALGQLGQPLLGIQPPQVADTQPYGAERRVVGQHVIERHQVVLLVAVASVRRPLRALIDPPPLANTSGLFGTTCTSGEVDRPHNTPPG